MPLPKLTFFDYETVSLADLKVVGQNNYLRPVHMPTWLMVAYQHGIGDFVHPQVMFNPYLMDWLNRDIREEDFDFDQLNTHATDFLPDDTLAVAWNTRFDRNVANMGGGGIPIERTLDAMALALVNNLPGKLDQAARALGIQGKLESGQRLIGKAHSCWRTLFGTCTPEDDMKYWRYIVQESEEGVLARETLRQLMPAMGRYAAQDLIATGNIWRRSLVPWESLEWAQYWANERINERGIPLDIPLARSCARFRPEEKAWADGKLIEMTGGRVTSVFGTGKLNSYVYETGTQDERNELIDKGKKAGISLGRDVIERLLYRNGLTPEDPDYCELAPPRFDDEGKQIAAGHRELLEHLLYARSTASSKFERMWREASPDDRLRGAFRWNGAGQTGRFSSQGAQMHNMVRAHLGEQEIPVCNALIDGVESLEELVALANLDETDAPAPVLSRLSRPAIMAPEGRGLVWGDYSQIEFVVNAWLSGARKAEELVLEPYRRGEDLYRLQAAESLHRPLEDITGDERQGYKVACLSLIFRGGVGAYTGMAAGYGIRPKADEAQEIVDNWRHANSWSGAFAETVTDAVSQAVAKAGHAVKAGRVSYMFHKGTQTLFCQLPSGRLLVYPRFRYEHWTVIDRKTGEPSLRHGFRCQQRGGRVALWVGKFIENFTQAAAADILRYCLVSLDNAGYCVVGHTHDEVLLETDAADMLRVAAELPLRMTGSGCPEWAHPIGIRAEADYGEFYSKVPAEIRLAA